MRLGVQEFQKFRSSEVQGFQKFRGFRERRVKEFKRPGVLGAERSKQRELPLSILQLLQLLNSCNS
jgi:hypothetical protein